MSQPIATFQTSAHRGALIPKSYGHRMVIRKHDGSKVVEKRFTGRKRDAVYALRKREEQSKAGRRLSK